MKGTGARTAHIGVIVTAARGRVNEPGRSDPGGTRCTACAPARWLPRNQESVCAGRRGRARRTGSRVSGNARVRALRRRRPAPVRLQARTGAPAGARQQRSWAPAGPGASQFRALRTRDPLRAVCLPPTRRRAASRDAERVAFRSRRARGPGPPAAVQSVGRTAPSPREFRSAGCPGPRSSPERPMRPCEPRHPGGKARREAPSRRQSRAPGKVVAAGRRPR